MNHRPCRPDRIVCVNGSVKHFPGNDHFHRTLAAILAHAAAVVAIAVAFVVGHVLWLASLSPFPADR